MPRLSDLVSVALLAGVALLAAPRPVAACSPVINPLLRIDEAFADDTVAPTAPIVSAVEVDRYQDDGNCADRGILTVALAATDDRAAARRLGFEVTRGSGTLPDGMQLTAEPVIPGGEDGMILHFDPASRGFAFTLEVRTVDLNGNRSAPTRVDVVDDEPEPTDGGCAAAPGGALAPILLALGLIARRRRRA